METQSLHFSALVTWSATALGTRIRESLHLTVVCACTIENRLKIELRERRGFHVFVPRASVSLGLMLINCCCLGGLQTYYQKIWDICRQSICDEC